MSVKFDMLKILKDLRGGKSVECPFCNNGHFVPVGDPATTHGFYCDKCGEQVNID